MAPADGVALWVGAGLLLWLWKRKKRPPPLPPKSQEALEWTLNNMEPWKSRLK